MDNYVGEIRMVAFNYAPEGWELCQGQALAIADNEILFQLLGTTYGGDGQSTFGLPDLQGRIPIGTGRGDGLSPRDLGEAAGAETVTLLDSELPAHTHALIASQDPQSSGSPAGLVLAAGGAVAIYTADRPTVALGGASIARAGGSQPHDNLQPFLVVNFIISLAGHAPAGPQPDDPTPFVGEIRMMAGVVTPAGWAACRGQMLPISQNIELYSLLGTTFGGDGKSSFALPDLHDAVPMGAGEGSGLSARNIGDGGGSETSTLDAAQIPAHTHLIEAAPGTASTRKPSPATALAASQGGNAYARSTGGLAPLAGQALAASGGDVPHNNMQPYQATNYCIAMQGAFPPRP
jgi:microcystin-dependent protein